MPWSRCLAVVLGVSGLLGLSAAGWLSRAGVQTASPLAPSVVGTPADIHVEDMRVFEQVDTVSDWEVLAKEAKVYQTAQRTELSTVTAHLTRSQEPPMSLTAASGQMDNATGNMAIEGQVRLHYQDGYTLETDRLYWHAPDGVLHTDAPVSMYNPSVHITGQGLQSKVEQQQIAIQHNVRASFQLQAEP